MAQQLLYLQGMPYYMLCMAPSTRFLPLLFGHCQTYVLPFLPNILFRPMASAVLLQVRERNVSFPVVLVSMLLAFLLLGFQSNSNLFPTLALPFVFDFWSCPDSRIPMQKAYVPKTWFHIIRHPLYVFSILLSGIYML